MHVATTFLATLALSAGALAAKPRQHTTTTTYSNIETLFTTETDSRGVITGMPTSIPPIVTSYPSSIRASMLSVQSEINNSHAGNGGHAPTTVVSTAAPGATGGSSGSGHGHGHGHGKSGGSSSDGGSGSGHGHGQQHGGSGGHSGAGGANSQSDPQQGSSSGSKGNAGSQVHAAGLGCLFAVGLAVVALL